MTGAHRSSPRDAGAARPVAGRCLRGLRLAELLAECAELDAFRRRSENLYERVRALFFLYAIHRFHLPARLAADGRATRARSALIPFNGYEHLLQRRFEEAIDHFLAVQQARGAERRHLQRPGRGLPPAGVPDAGRPGPPQRALGARQPVDVPHGPPGRPPAAHPAGAARTRHRPTAPTRSCASARRCAWTSRTAAGATSSSWAWTFPKGAKVLNVSIDLGVHGRDCRAAPAGRGLPARDRRAGAPPGERRPRRHGRHHEPGRGVRLRQGLPGPAQGGGDRRGHRAAGHRGLGPEPGRAAGAASSARAAGWRSSAT